MSGWERREDRALGDVAVRQFGELARRRLLAPSPLLSARQHQLTAAVGFPQPVLFGVVLVPRALARGVIHEPAERHLHAADFLVPDEAVLAPPGAEREVRMVAVALVCCLGQID